MFDYRRQAFAVVALCATLAIVSCSRGPEVPRITRDALKLMLDAQGVVVLDVMRDEDWRLTEKKIKGASRREPGEVNSWAEQYPKDQTMVLYCS